MINQYDYLLILHLSLKELYAHTPNLDSVDCKDRSGDKYYDHDVQCMHTPENHNSVVKVLTSSGSKLIAKDVGSCMIYNEN